MSPEDLLARRVTVFGSALVYWIGVFIQARRVRKQIGRSPNVRPRGAKERWLWLGWFGVVAGWMALPFVAREGTSWVGLDLIPGAWHRAGWVPGGGLLLAGYVGTLWCYAAMGGTWRMGINRREKNPLITTGPFRWVRHPIYLFQLVMLAGVACLLPTLLALGLLALHLVCLLLKAKDEERYLNEIHGQDYADYCLRAGRLFPRIRGKRARLEG
jgi:protein-S-isoprenylcysteine O-methyltransferase Ste14